MLALMIQVSPSPLNGADNFVFVSAAFFSQRAISQRSPTAGEKGFGKEEFETLLGIGG